MSVLYFSVKFSKRHLLGIQAVSPAVTGCQIGPKFDVESSYDEGSSGIKSAQEVALV